MNITLRKASALQNSINEVLRGIVVKGEIALTEFHQAEQEISQAVVTARADIQRHDQLMSALYEIRGAVAAANHASGVNRNLTVVAELEKKIQFYTSLAGKEVRDRLDIVNGKLERLRTTEAKSRMYGYGDTVSTGVFSSEDIASFKKVVGELKRTKQRIQDDVLEANVRNEITLSASVVALLQVEGLV